MNTSSTIYTMGTALNRAQATTYPSPCSSKATGYAATLWPSTATE